MRHRLRRWGRRPAKRAKRVSIKVGPCFRVAGEAGRRGRPRPRRRLRRAELVRGRSETSNLGISAVKDRRVFKKEEGVLVRQKSGEGN